MHTMLSNAKIIHCWFVHMVTLYTVGTPLYPHQVQVGMQENRTNDGCEKLLRRLSCTPTT